MDRKQLEGYGIDYDKGIENCMGDEAFYKKILGMFMRDKCFGSSKEALENGDYAKMLSGIHELKGISGNAALSELYRATVPLVELLRSDAPDKAEAGKLFEKVESAYERAYEGIRAFIG